MQRRLVCQIRAGGGLHEDEGNCLKYLKREWNREEGRKNKDFKKGGKLGQRMGALKRGAVTPLQTMEQQSLSNQTVFW